MRNSVHRSDFRQVTPTDAELAQWLRRYPRQAVGIRAEHIPCGRRIWYSGIGIVSHVRACKGRQ
jgi:hypothetical protein